MIASLSSSLRATAPRWREILLPLGLALFAAGAVDLFWPLAGASGAALALAWLGTPAAAIFLAAASGPRRSAHLVAGGLAWALAAVLGALFWRHGPALHVPQCAVWSALWIIEARSSRRTPLCAAALLLIVLAALPSAADLGWQTPAQIAVGLLLGALAAGLVGGPLARKAARVEAAARGPAGAGLVAAGLATLAAAASVAEALGPAAPGRVVAGLGFLAALRWAWCAGVPGAWR